MVDSDTPLDPRTEDLLREFLGKERQADSQGYTRQAVLKAVDKIGVALQDHQRECAKRWEENEARHRSTETRLRNLEAAGTGTPPGAGDRDSGDPAEITSSHRIDVIAEKVRNATLESLRVPGADPDAYVRQVVAEEQEELEKRAELKRLKKKEDDDASAREEEARERRERNRLLFVGIASVVGGAGVLAFVQFVANHVH